MTALKDHQSDHAREAADAPRQALQASAWPTSQSQRSYNVGDALLLSSEEEKQYSQVIEAGLRAKALLEAHGDEMTEEDLRRNRDLVAAGVEHEQKFVVANLRLIQFYLQRMIIPAHVSRDDVFQAAAEEMHTAVRKFDWRKGYKFSTYATWWIRQALSHETDAQSNSLSGTQQAISQARQADRVSREHFTQTGEQPNDELVAGMMNISVERLHTVRSLGVPTSLDQPMNGAFDDSRTVGDTLTDAHADSMFESVEQEEMVRVVHEMLQVLPDDERDALMIDMSGEQRSFLRGESGKKHRADVRRAKSRLYHPSNPSSAAAQGLLSA